MYENGVGVSQNYERAFEWYFKSANQKQDNSLSQNSLGIMYEEGRGVRRDLSKAKEWFNKACSNGIESSCADYDRLTKYN
jgi:TPR repeat protein